MSVERVAGSSWNQWPDVHGMSGRITVESAVCHQNSKKSGEFAVCLALRFGPKNVEFGGMRQALGRDCLIPNRPLGLVIKGSSEGPQPVSNQFE
jgi:hypothetical protein